MASCIHVYISCRSSFMKRAEECKKLAEYIALLFRCETHTISSADLSQSWENQPQKFQFCSSFFLSFLFLSHITWKLKSVCEYLHTKWPFCYWRSSFWFGVVNELWPWNCLTACMMLLLRCSLASVYMYVSLHGINSQAIPGLLRTHATDCNEFASK